MSFGDKNKTEIKNRKWNYPDYIEALRPRGSVLGLSSMERLVKELGNPEKNLAIVHIAGTNGKGSTLAFLASILKEAGYTVGQYISPTIKCYEERFQINREVISGEDLEECFEEVWKAILRLEQKGFEWPTLFEAETAVAFVYFKKKNVDYVLLETGMGGKLDATNIIRHPILSIISSVSFDHMQFLGDTLEKIAANKAGIIKRNCPVLLAENPKEVKEVLLKKAVEENSQYYLVLPEEYEVVEETFESSLFSFEGDTYEIFLPGRHQISNAVTALKAAIIMQEKYDNKGLITKDSMKKGLKKCTWSGRLEVLHREPIFIRDGAHNPDGARKLAEYVEKHFTNRSILYIIGVLSDKDYETMLSLLLKTGKRLYVFKPDNPRGLEAETLARAARPYGIYTVVCAHVRDAIKRAVTESTKEDVLILCGSLSFMEEMGDLDDYWRT